LGGVVGALLVVGWPDLDQQRSREAPETCWATYKRQVINLWNSCILLVDLFESCMHCFLHRLVLLLPHA
jgi:hypothetical protein